MKLFVIRVSMLIVTVMVSIFARKPTKKQVSISS